MNEASKTGPLLTELRRRLPGAVVVKHADKSMISMCDASVTHDKRTTWFEIKLFRPPKRWDGETVPFKEIAEESKAQFAMMKALAREGYAYYIFFVAKTKLWSVWCPTTEVAITFDDKQKFEDYLVIELVQANRFN